jgi:hypothetical protein
MKIARVSGARLDLQDRDGRLDIFGSEEVGPHTNPIPLFQPRRFAKQLLVREC